MIKRNLNKLLKRKFQIYELNSNFIIISLSQKLFILIITNK